MRHRISRWRAALAEVPTLREKIGVAGLYVALRFWSALINVFPVRMNLETARLFGLIWWYVKRSHRERAMENLRPALGDRYSEAELLDIAKRSFQHFTQLYLVELVMTPKLVNAWSWSKYIELGDLSVPLRQLLSREPTIMLTPHFGNYELLGYTIARLGLPLTAIMRPLDNALVNESLEESRKAGGLTLLHKTGAMEEANAVIDRGEPLCFIADQDAGRKGVFAPFFNRQASWYKSIAILALYKNVTIIVGGAFRTRQGFHYRIHVERIIRPDEWRDQADPIQWITQNFAASLENLIRRAPEQYLWVHRRWKTRPKSELAGK
ncbi:MAG: lysophospholipid acyltransferase family protein [Phycisphaerae bacterium]